MSTALSRPMLVEMNPSARSSRTMAESASGAVLSELTTATDNAHNGVRQTPSVRLGAAKPSKDVRAGLVSHLRQLMREKLFQWPQHSAQPAHRFTRDRDGEGSGTGGTPGKDSRSVSGSNDCAGAAHHRDGSGAAGEGKVAERVPETQATDRRLDPVQLNDLADCLLNTSANPADAVRCWPDPSARPSESPACGKDAFVFPLRLPREVGISPSF